jgi:hypothetical protein
LIELIFKTEIKTELLPPTNNSMSLATSRWITYGDMIVMVNDANIRFNSQGVSVKKELNVGE